jgi:hypothetical protein
MNCRLCAIIQGHSGKCWDGERFWVSPRVVRSRRPLSIPPEPTNPTPPRRSRCKAILVCTNTDEEKGAQRCDDMAEAGSWFCWTHLQVHRDGTRKLEVVK